MCTDLNARLEGEMAPPSESSRLESSTGFVEYVGSNKLKDKKVLITGGESVSYDTITPLDLPIDI